MSAVVYVMRGIPGCGKTWRARRLLEKLDSERYSIVSSDEIMFERYQRFCPDRLSEVHAECFQRFCEILEGPEEGVIVDNTNISEWEWHKYVAVAKLVGRRVVLQDIVARTLEDVRTCWRRQRWQDGRRLPAEVFDRLVGRYWREPQPREDGFSIHRSFLSRT